MLNYRWDINFQSELGIHIYYNNGSIGNYCIEEQDKINGMITYNNNRLTFGLKF